jgi:hypothetical protein
VENQGALSFFEWNNHPLHPFFQMGTKYFGTWNIQIVLQQPPVDSGDFWLGISLGQCFLKE